MDQSRIFDELYDQFQAVPLKKIDVKQNVLQKISQKNHPYGGRKMKAKIGILVAVCMVFLVSAAYAAVQVYQLRNENGEVVYQAKQENVQEQPEIKRPEPEMIQQQMVTLPDFASFTKEIEGFANIPDKLAETFVFTKGVIFYSGTEHKTENIKTANAIYGSESRKITLIAKKADPQEIVYAMPVTMEKVKLKKNEGVYKVIASPNGTELKQLTWVKGENTIYSVQSDDKDVTKSALIEIAETLESH